MITSVVRWSVACGVALLVATLAAPSFGVCQPANCDDGNPCTDDICDPTLGCAHANISVGCSDGNTCTINDVCTAGTCVGGNIASGCTACDAVATIPPQGGTFVGTTNGTGALAGSCGNSGTSGERVYAWTPATSGSATFATCGAGTFFDTSLYVRTGGCTGAEIACNGNTTACAAGSGPNDGSRITLAVTAGQTYYLVVDGTNGSNGQYALTVSPPSLCGNNLREASEQCDGTDRSDCSSGQCTPACTCVVPAGGLPDLSPQVFDVGFDFGSRPSAGDVAEGCAEATSGVDLLRFTTVSRNIGTADFALGNPQCPAPCTTHPLEVCGNPQFICSPAQGHNHAHYQNFARYELIDATGQSIVVGHKQGFCLMDEVCSNPKFSCTDQGITPGCVDQYFSHLGCQYIDVTGAPGGNYTLRVTLDPFNLVGELNNTNNMIDVPVTIPFAPVTPCQNAATIPPQGGVITGSTSGSGTLSGTCSPTSGSPEKVYQWTPSASGTATLETCGSGTSYDAVVYMRTGTCAGPELACGSIWAGVCSVANGKNGSRITPTVTAGQLYYIIVDGYNGETGNFTLNVVPPGGGPPPATPTPISTPTPGGPAPSPTRTRTPTALPPGNACDTATTIPAAGGTFTGSTTGVSTITGPCAVTNNSPEKAFQWTPAASGTATIETCGNGTNFDTVAYVQSGTCASGTSVGCNDDTIGCLVADGTGSDRHGSRVTFAASAGQTYFIIVDGFNGKSGAFSLTVIPPAGPTVTPVQTPTRTPTLAISTATPTATPTSTPTQTPTATSTPTSTATSASVPTVTITATEPPSPTATTAATNTFGPTETATATRTSTPTATSTLTSTPTATPTSTATSTRTAPATATATRTSPPTATNTAGAGGCSGITVIPAQGGTFTGTTAGTSTLSGTCALTNNSPERVLQWTPATSGTATLQTCSPATNYDTVLYMRSGTCSAGTQVACNDDTIGCLVGDGTGSDRHGSRITPVVTAGQTYFIVVDGFNGKQGTFSVTVTPPP